MKIVFASNNPNKLKEIRQMTPDHIEILSLKDIECFDELPEERDTLEGNALQKAEYVYEHFGHACFSDDTGLEVDALDGRPGVYSARYAGENCSPEDNMRKLLGELEGEDHREAVFKTVIAFITDEGAKTFEGEVAGEIISDMTGDQGFGYDPIFKPAGYKQTFAQMSSEEKNQISHRKRALKKFMDYLNG